MTQSYETTATLALTLPLFYFLYKYIYNIRFLSNLFKYGPIGDGAFYWMHFKRDKSAFLLTDDLYIKEDSAFFLFISSIASIFNIKFFSKPHLINILIKLFAILFLITLVIIGNIPISFFSSVLAFVYFFAFPDNFLKVNLQSVQLYNFQPRYFSFLITSVSYTLMIFISLFSFNIYTSFVIYSILIFFLLLSAYISKFSRQVLLFCLFPSLILADYKLFFLSLLLILILIVCDSNFRLSCYHHYKHSKYLFSIRHHSYQASYSKYLIVTLVKSIFESRFILFTLLYYIIFIPILYFAIILQSPGNNLLTILLIPVFVSFVTGFKIFAFVGESFRYLISTYFVAIPFVLLYYQYNFDSNVVYVMLISSFCCYVFLKIFDKQYFNFQIDDDISNESLFSFYDNAVPLKYKIILRSAAISCLPFRQGSILAAENLFLKTSEFVDNLGRVTSSYFELYPFMPITSKCFRNSEYFLAKKIDLQLWLDKQNLRSLPSSGYIKFIPVAQDKNFSLFKIIFRGF